MSAALPSIAWFGVIAVTVSGAEGCAEDDPPQPVIEKRKAEHKMPKHFKTDLRIRYLRFLNDSKSAATSVSL